MLAPVKRNVRRLQCSHHALGRILIYILSEKGINMLDWIIKIVDWIASLWNDLPPETREKIIESAAEAYDNILREFYASQKKGN